MNFFKAQAYKASTIVASFFVGFVALAIGSEAKNERLNLAPTLSSRKKEELKSYIVPIATLSRGGCGEGWNEEVLICGGTRIRDRIVFTNAHCFPSSLEQSSTTLVFNRIEAFPKFIAGMKSIPRAQSNASSCRNESDIYDLLEKLQLTKGRDVLVLKKGIYRYSQHALGFTDYALIETAGLRAEIAAVKAEPVSSGTPISLAGIGATDCRQGGSYHPDQATSYDFHYADFVSISKDAYQTELEAAGGHLKDWERQSLNFGIVVRGQSEDDYLCGGDSGSGGFVFNGKSRTFEFTGGHSLYWYWQGKKAAPFFALAPIASPTFCHFVEHETPLSKDFKELCRRVPKLASAEQLCYARDFQDHPIAACQARRAH